LFPQEDRKVTEEGTASINAEKKSVAMKRRKRVGRRSYEKLENAAGITAECLLSL
jgi:hypothetical protein